MAKKLLVLGVALALVLSIGSVSFGARKVFIAGLGKALLPYWDEVGLGMKQAGEKLGVDVEFMCPRMEDVAEQVRIFENFIAKGADAIVFAASDPNAFDTVVKQALKRGIPVITFDSDAPKSGRLLYIGPNNYNSGKLAGETMAKLLNGKGKVAIQVGSLTAINARERIQGFKDAVAKYPGISIVTTQNDKEDPQVAAAQSETILVTYPDLAGFYGVYCYNPAAQARAVKAAGKAGQIKIVGFDAEPETVKFIKEGVIDATMDHRQYRFGYLAASILYDMVTIGVDNTLIKLGFDPKADPEKNVLTTPTEIVSKENVGEYEEWLRSIGH